MGKVYKYGFIYDSDSVPDLGGLEFTGKDEQGRYEYMGSLSDAQYLDMLPKVPRGSTAVLTDEGDSGTQVYQYSENQHKWKLL